jgi:hypothetical protein
MYHCIDNLYYEILQDSAIHDRGPTDALLIDTCYAYVMHMLLCLSIYVLHANNTGAKYCRMS